MITWVIIANNSFAEFYSVKGRDIKKVDQIDFPEGRMKPSDFYSDSAGRGFESSGTGKHAFTSKMDVRTHEQELFAHRIMDMIRKAYENQEFERFAIIAPPNFLGELRKVLPGFLKKVLWKEVGKDIPEATSDYEKMEKMCRLLDIGTPHPSPL